MSKVAFVMLPEEGHLLATFKLARSLKRRGHQICYLATKRNQEYISAQGFECIALAEGFWQAREFSWTSVAEGLRGINEIVFGHRKEIARLLEQVRPDLLIIDSYLPALAFIATESGISLIFFNVAFDIYTPGLLLNYLESVTGDSAAISLLQKVPLLISYPLEFEFAHRLADGRTLAHVEAFIDLERDEVPFDWSKINETMPLIYCTLGSQAHLFAGSRQFFQTVVAAVGERQNWQLLLSVGKHLSVDDFDSIPANVRVVNWAPQLEVLRRASLMITHGGISTVKECIYFDVPMIVFPMMRDQPMSGARIIYHGLGLRGDIHRISAEQLRSLIEKIEQDPSYRQRVRAMGKKFREAEELGRGAKIIEKILAASNSEVHFKSTLQEVSKAEQSEGQCDIVEKKC